MDAGTFVSTLVGKVEGLKAEVIPDGLWKRIVREESTVRACGGNMPMEDLGLKEMCRHDVRLFLHGAGLDLPEFSNMSMIDEAGNEIGKHLKPSEIPEFESRDDVVFLSYDFVMFTGVTAVGETRIVMNAVPYRGSNGWVPEDMHATLWFPSTTTDLLIHDHYGLESGRTGSIILGFDVS